MPPLQGNFTTKLLAAKAGDPAALASLGVTYFAQRSIPTDMEAAARLLRAAANEGDAEAQNSLGAFYFFGVGVDRNEAESVRWFRRAAEQGHPDAQHRLGSAYRTRLGFGVTPNDAEAVMWFRKAASQGHAEAQYDLARQLLHGEGVAKDATEAVRLWRQLAERGHAAAQSMLGRCYATGDGVVKNPVEATTWLRKAADQGYPQAKEMLANVSAGRAPTGIHEVMEEYDRLHNIPIDVTQTISHEAFVRGLQDGTVGFAPRGGEAVRLASGGGRVFFTICLLLYLVAPVLVIPVWAYHERNWWLLLGIVVASLIAPQLAQRKGSSIGGLLSLASIIFFFTKGVHNLRVPSSQRDSISPDDEALSG